MKNQELNRLKASAIFAAFALVASAQALVKVGNEPKWVKAEKARSLKMAQAVPGEFVVRVKKSNGLSKLGLQSALSASGFNLEKSVNQNEGVYLVKVKAPNIAASSRQVQFSALENTSLFEVVEPNYVYSIAGFTKANPMAEPEVPGGSMFERLWGMHNFGQKDKEGSEGLADADIDAPEAWAIFKGSKDIVLAVVDTGVDYTHPALKANIWSKPGSPDVHGFNAITDKEDPMDDHSHGTHCAGTIGASGLNPDGVVGVNHDLSIMGAKFLSGSGSGTLADAIKAIDYATENGAQIMSNSWGGGGFSEELKASIERARDKNILFVAAAGNDSANNDNSPKYPASYEVANVLAVAATTNKDELAYFSNYGQRTVHIGAPGHNILSTVIGGKYDVYSGTSMATPHVAGAAALLLGKEPSLKYNETRERIILTGDKVASLKKKVSAHGARLNVHNMLVNHQPPGPVPIPEDSWSSLVAQPVATSHPYLDNAKQTWTLEQPGATFMRVVITKLKTESGYDFLKIKSAKTSETVEALTGSMLQGGVVEVEGDKVILEFNSDSSVADWGFEISGYQWSAFKP